MIRAAETRAVQEIQIPKADPGWKREIENYVKSLGADFQGLPFSYPAVNFAMRQEEYCAGCYGSRKLHGCGYKNIKSGLEVRGDRIIPVAAPCLEISFEGE